MSLEKAIKDLDAEIQRTSGSRLEDFSDESQQRLFAIWVEVKNIKKAVRQWQLGIKNEQQ